MSKCIRLNYTVSWVLDDARRVTILANSNPIAPNSPSPSDTATGVPVSTALDWSGGDPDGDAVTYDVYLEAGDSSPDILICDDISVSTCTPPSQLSNTTLYYWRVVSTDDRGGVTAGPTWSFTTLGDSGTIMSRSPRLPG